MTTQPAAPELIELERAPTSIEDVLAGLLRNTAGGLAIGALVWTALTLTPLDWHTVNAWAGRAALAGIAGALIVYGLGDDTFNWLKRRELARALADAEGIIDEVDDELAALRYQLDTERTEVSRLKAEVAALRSSRNYVPGTPPVSDPTMEDAIQLVRLYYQHGAHPSRQHMSQYYGWSERRYPAAFALLKQAGVVTVAGTRVRWTDGDATTALARLSGNEIQSSIAIEPES